MNCSKRLTIPCGLLALVLLTLHSSPALAHLSILRQGEESAGFRESGDYFGGALAYGDFNGDGKDDLATGAHWEAAGSIDRVGQVTISYGSQYGLTHVGSELLEPGQFGLPLEEHMHFGSAMAVADLDRDGYEDLVVGSPGANYNGVTLAGRICLYFGGPGGLDARFTFVQEDWNGFSISSDYFGSSIVISDFNDDLYPDIAVGSPGLGQQAGTVFVRYGTAQGPFGSDQLFSIEQLGWSYQPDDYFGFSLATGNVIGDTHTDLLVGAPYRDAFGKTAAGVCYTLPGSSSGLDESAAMSFTAKLADDCSTAAAFGFSLTTTANGIYDRIFIGEPDRTLGSIQRAGRVVAASGSVDGPDPDTGTFLVRELFDGPGGADERFGFSLDSGKFEESGFEALIIGTPFADYLGTNSGVCHIIFGGVDGIGNSGYNYFTQSPIGETPEAGDLLGYRVSLGGQFDSSNNGTAVVGVPGEDNYAGLVHIIAPWRQFYFQSHKTAAVFGCHGDLVFTQRPFDQVFIASTTKIMTVLLACERASLPPGDSDFVDINTQYTVPDWVAEDIGGSSANLLEGEIVTLEDLMHMALLISGNDAAHAIADLLHGSGGPFESLPLFINRMNERAVEIGMLDTAFNNPNGFEQEAVGNDLGEHFSTAYDMALLSQEALQNPLFRQISTTTSYTAQRIQPGGGFVNDNFMSFQGWILNNNMGVTGTGLKGGWTPAAQTTWCVSALEPFGDAIVTTFGTADGPTARQDAGRLIGLGVGSCVTLEEYEEWDYNDLHVRPNILEVANERYRIRSSARQAQSQQLNLFHASSDVEETNARITVSRSATVEIPEFAEAHYGIGPFEGHEDILITNLEDRLIKIKVTTPLFSSFFDIAAGGTITVPNAYGPTGQFDWLIKNYDNSEDPIHLEVAEEYFYEVYEPAEPTSEPVFSVVIEGDPLLRNDSVVMDIEWFVDGNEYVFVGHSPDVVVDAPEESGLDLPGTAVLHLQPAHPNPFAESASIRFTLTEPAEVGVSIFDAAGRRIRRYAPRQKDAGLWSLTWDGTSEDGTPTPPGVYFYHVEAGGEIGAGGKLVRIR